MASIFEDLMLQNSATKGVVNLTESVKTGKVSDNDVKKFNVSKFKVESRRVFESETFDDLDKQFAADPESEDEGEVVLVIDPEINAEDELPEDAAENAVGSYVYKCPVCGSNYLCDCDASMEESVEVDDNGVPTECPICGDDAEQILVGEIAPVEGAGEEEKSLDPVEPEDGEKEEEPESEPEVPEDDKQEESVKAGLKESTKQEESVDLQVKDDVDASVVITPKDECPECDAAIIPEEGDLEFDEERFESLVNKHLDDTFKDSPKMKVESIKVSGNRLTIDYTMSLGKKTSKGSLFCEGFDVNKNFQRIVLRDKGIITESVGRESKFEARAMIRNGHLSIF